MVARTFPRSNGALEAIYAFIREFVQRSGLDPEIAYDLDVIAEELFTNMVKYGRGTRREIEIALEWRAPTLAIRLRDFDVERWDPTESPPVDTSRPIAERRAGGLGIHLVRQIADRILYNYDDRGRESTITVTKVVNS
jgi:anti-sigma regulatory factor (Ser/Thr protein kinase)